MTEDLLHQLEEKMMLLLSEVEGLRREVARLQQDNAGMKAERENHSRKLHDMISLLDVVNPHQPQTHATHANLGVPVGSVVYHEEVANG